MGKRRKEVEECEEDGRQLRDGEGETVLVG